MQVKDIIDLIEEIAPMQYAEDFDNTGLLIGAKNWDVSGILVTLDTLESVVDEAIEKDCNFILSFHPIVFSGLKKLTGSTYVERVVAKAIKNDIAIFAIHTALDNDWNGVNAMICEKLRLTERKILLPKKDSIKKLSTFVPKEDAETVRKALFQVGAGSIGNYNNCSFNVEGTGSFKGNEQSNPVRGEKGAIHYENETQVTMTFARHLESQVLQSLFESHPYEEVAYEISTLENKNQHLGMGMIGTLERPMTQAAFLEMLKSTIATDCVRHSALLSKPIKHVAVLGGSGSFAIGAAKAAGADAFVTADLKYHDFFRAENQLLLADVGHYESEQYTKELLVNALTKKITNFAPSWPSDKVVLSQINTNPISYF